MSDLSPEAKRILQNYLDGEVSNAELEDWLVQNEYDEEIAQPVKDALAPLRLAVTEAQEGLRDDEDVLDKVAALLAPSTPERYVKAFRAGSSTSWQSQGEQLTASPTQVRRVGIST